jgi:hypothetical protein
MTPTDPKPTPAIRETSWKRTFEKTEGQPDTHTVTLTVVASDYPKALTRMAQELAEHLAACPDAPSPSSLARALDDNAR